MQLAYARRGAAVEIVPKFDLSIKLSSVLDLTRFTPKFTMHVQWDIFGSTTFVIMISNEFRLQLTLTKTDLATGP